MPDVCGFRHKSISSKMCQFYGQSPEKLPKKQNNTRYICIFSNETNRIHFHNNCTITANTISQVEWPFTKRWASVAFAESQLMASFVFIVRKRETGCVVVIDFLMFEMMVREKWKYSICLDKYICVADFQLYLYIFIFTAGLSRRLVCTLGKDQTPRKWQLELWMREYILRAAYFKHYNSDYFPLLIIMFIVTKYS